MLYFSLLNDIWTNINNSIMLSLIDFINAIKDDNNMIDLIDLYNFLKHCINEDIEKLCVYENKF